MLHKAIIEEIEQDIKDVIDTEFFYTTAMYVPSTNDATLSFERGAEKKGKMLFSCVLYVDIRNSVALTKKHQSITMGKIYTAFTKAVIKAARYHNGHTRNIIGDRVMIVFPAEKCCKNAVECAITINHIAFNILVPKFSGVDFKCGIGIDCGNLKIIKVGIQRNGNEGPENKGLVWTGRPANIASRLTDMAHKRVVETYFDVESMRVNPNPNAITTSDLRPSTLRPTSILDMYYSLPDKREMTDSQFVDAISTNDKGEITINGDKLISFTKRTNPINYPPILITESVFDGLEDDGVNNKQFLSYWKEQKGKIKDVRGMVYGADLTWKE